MVRAKFIVTNIEDAGQKDGVDLKSVYMLPVVTGSPENEKFYAYTPHGQVLLSTVNPAAYGQFEVGKEYYGDFSPAN